MDEKLQDILLSVMNDDTIEITLDSIISVDLGISSFDLLQVVYGIETDYSITIPKDRIKSIVTVNDLIDCINTLTQK